MWTVSTHILLSQIQRAVGGRQYGGAVEAVRSENGIDKFRGKVEGWVWVRAIFRRCRENGSIGDVVLWCSIKMNRLALRLELSNCMCCCFVCLPYFWGEQLTDLSSGFIEIMFLILTAPAFALICQTKQFPWCTRKCWIV